MFFLLLKLEQCDSKLVQKNIFSANLIVTAGFNLQVVIA